MNRGFTQRFVIRSYTPFRFATGDFASVEEAVRQLIDDRIAEIASNGDGEQDDMAWAKPYNSFGNK